MNVLHVLRLLLGGAQNPEPAPGQLPDNRWRSYLEGYLHGCLGDRQTARWFAAELAARRLCGCRFSRILLQARAAAECGPPRIAQAYLHGELRRLAARCGRPCPIPLPVTQMTQMTQRRTAG